MEDLTYYSSVRAEIMPFVPAYITKTLDVGCGTGEFSALIKKERSAETWGIEMSETAVEIAKGNVDHILKGTFEEVQPTLPQNYFDCVFFNDVLEHMPYPNECLIQLKENLQKNATVIASIPNIRHISILKEILLRKDFRYRDFGILDRTHLRFFTKKSIVRMFVECGYEIQIVGLNKGNDSWKCDLLNIASLGLLFNDIKYTQYLVIAKVTH